ncbi:MAG: DedA family protein [Candidatus Caenarcaniphilales bacterium]|nr:DedA family protein [Candidatus Caenarcaniphilales bacterium]
MFEQIFDLTTDIISKSGYIGICVFMAMESMIFPIPSEAVMPFAGFLAAQGRFTMLGVAIASSLGSILGSGLSYAIGLWGGRPFLRKFGKYFLLDAHHLDWTEKFFDKYGDKAVLISRFIPVVRHLISIPAGTAKMNLWRFSIFTLIGATIWNMFLAWLGLVMMENWASIKKYTHYLDYLVVFCLVGGVIYLYSKIMKSRLQT